MPGFCHEALQIDARIAEAGARRALHGLEGRLQRACILAKLHADAAAAGGGFQHHRIADALRLRQRFLDGVEQATAGQQRHAAFARQFARRVLQSECCDILRRGADEGDALFRETRGKADIL